MKKLSELNRGETIDLLKSIASKEIDAKDLTQESLVVADDKEWFLGLMISANQVSGKPLPVTFIGEAKKARDKFFEGIE